MQTFSGLLILFSFVVLGRAAYEGWIGQPDAWSTAIVGLFFLGLGFYLAARAPDASVVEETTGAPTDDAETTPARAQARPPAEAVFSIIQTGSDAVLDRVMPLLDRDPRIISVTDEAGRWYSVPDGDDLPEWFALRVRCPGDQIDEVMRDTTAAIRETLGDEAVNRLTINRYS